MALEATHMRFALDLKERLGVRNVCEYLSGTIYPDSRYVTGIDRNLTHPRDLFEQKHLELTDFEKGWFAHLICDDVQFRITMEKFPHIQEMAEGQGNDRWVRHSALKILQDIDDAKQFDIASFLHCLSYVETPNGEDGKKMQEYNSMFVELYKDPATLSIEKEHEMWEKWGIGTELAEKLRDSALEESKNDTTMMLLSDIYAQMLTEANAHLDNTKLFV